MCACSDYTFHKQTLYEIDADNVLGLTHFLKWHQFVVFFIFGNATWQGWEDLRIFSNIFSCFRLKSRDPERYNTQKQILWLWMLMFNFPGWHDILLSIHLPFRQTKKSPRFCLIFWKNFYSILYNKRIFKPFFVSREITFFLFWY